MAKDPAFLFYSQDWIVGCQTLTYEERGKYITIIAQMHQQGRMNKETICLLVGSVSDNLMGKFRLDEAGKYYSHRLEKEAEIRAKYTESRRKNGMGGGRPPSKKQKKTVDKTYQKPHANHMDNHMEDENEDENEDVIEKENRKESPKGKQDYHVISDLIAYLKEKAGLQSLDGNEKTNRNYCQHLLKKIKKEHPENDEKEGARLIISVACEDIFHRKNCTNFQYLYYNYNKIIKSKQNGHAINSKYLAEEIERRYGSE